MSTEWTLYLILALRSVPSRRVFHRLRCPRFVRTLCVPTSPGGRPSPVVELTAPGSPPVSPLAREPWRGGSELGTSTRCRNPQPLEFPQPVRLGLFGEYRRNRYMRLAHAYLRIKVNGSISLTMTFPLPSLKIDENPFASFRSSQFMCCTAGSPVGGVAVGNFCSCRHRQVSNELVRSSSSMGGSWYSTTDAPCLHGPPKIFKARKRMTTPYIHGHG